MASVRTCDALLNGRRTDTDMGAGRGRGVKWQRGGGKEDGEEEEDDDDDDWFAGILL
jgi:hypothetical protein